MSRALAITVTKEVVSALLCLPPELLGHCCVVWRKLDSIIWCIQFLLVASILG